jgi:hypothetical protein
MYHGWFLSSWEAEVEVEVWKTRSLVLLLVLFLLCVVRYLYVEIWTLSNSLTVRKYSCI